MEPIAIDKFTGTLTSRNDGENNSAEGTVLVDGVRQAIVVNASGQSTEYTLDGETVEDDALQEQLDLYFADIWPPEDGSWDATVEEGVIRRTPMPFEDPGGGPLQVLPGGPPEALRKV